MAGVAKVVGVADGRLRDACSSAAGWARWDVNPLLALEALHDALYLSRSSMQETACAHRLSSVLMQEIGKRSSTSLLQSQQTACSGRALELVKVKVAHAIQGTVAV